MIQDAANGRGPRQAGQGRDLPRRRRRGDRRADAAVPRRRTRRPHHLVAGRAWVNYDADYLQGNYDFEVEGGSTEPRNEAFRRQSALQLVDAMAPVRARPVSSTPRASPATSCSTASASRTSASSSTGRRTADAAQQMDPAPTACPQRVMPRAATGTGRSDARRPGGWPADRADADGRAADPTGADGTDGRWWWRDST